MALSSQFEDNIGKYFEANQALLLKLCSLPPKTSASAIQQPGERLPNRVIQFKNQKITEKDGVADQPSYGQEDSKPLFASRNEKFQRNGRTPRPKR
jgi:hypothetical protein